MYKYLTCTQIILGNGRFTCYSNVIPGEAYNLKFAFMLLFIFLVSVCSENNDINIEKTLQPISFI